jgi:putative flippase GtrA
MHIKSSVIIKPLQSQIVRFLIIGTFNNAIGYLIFVCLFFVLKNIYHYQVILIISFMIMTPISYLNMKLLVFKTKKNYFREFSKFIASVIFIYIANAYSLFIFVEIIKFNILLSQFLSMLIAAIVSYLVNKVVVFRIRKT